MSDAPERVHVRWGKAGDTRVTYMEERFLPPDNGAEYIRADLVATKDARIADLEKQLAEAQAIIRGKTFTVDHDLERQLAGARDAALEEAARLIDKRADDYHAEHGSYDYSTGVTEYPGNGSESMEEWEELADAIRALKGVKP